ncbi:hypothetical protein [Streptomyces sp. NPDC002922]|uniref:hypothetical protein n=1 Tax=Streptomyces sp. NPDC002922 TaxID=3154439 RepID=UPI0033A33009
MSKEQILTTPFATRRRRVARTPIAPVRRIVQHARGQNWAAPPLTHAELIEIEETLFDDDSA